MEWAENSGKEGYTSTWTDGDLTYSCIHILAGPFVWDTIGNLANLRDLPKFELRTENLECNSY